MKIIKYTDPYTLKEKEVEFDEFHFDLAEIIRKGLDGFEPTEIVVTENALLIGVNDPPISKREPGVPFKGKYRITIEKFG
jgi:hypothetical protein